MMRQNSRHSSPVFHITTGGEALHARSTGEYVAKAYGVEGFIHCSYANQLCRVANARFRGRTDLVILEIDCGRLDCDVIDENLEGGLELFPHIYGPVPISAIVRVHAFPCDAEGAFTLPASIAAAVKP